jgi:hypothetical protein
MGGRGMAGKASKKKRPESVGRRVTQNKNQDEGGGALLDVVFQYGTEHCGPYMLSLATALIAVPVNILNIVVLHDCCKEFKIEILMKGNASALKLISILLLIY